MNLIKEQYGQYGQMSGAEVNYGGNSSPVGSTATSDSGSNDSQVQKLQQQVNMLQREVRKLHNRHRELFSELQRLRKQE
jgi:predicted RNase H-like nuclease (RuvC/YqgF family)